MQDLMHKLLPTGEPNIPHPQAFLLSMQENLVFSFLFSRERLALF